MLWYLPGTGADYLWYVRRGVNSVRSPPTTINGFHEPNSGSFNDDAVDDVLRLPLRLGARLPLVAVAGLSLPSSRALGESDHESRGDRWTEVPYADWAG